MPGLHLVHYFDQCPAQCREQLEGSLASLLHEPEYEKKLVLDEADTLLGVTTHPAYPVTVIEDREFFVCLDGVIYGLSNETLRTELLGVARLVSSRGPHVDGQLARWLRGIDGEFVLFIKDKTSGFLYLLNDLAGLLPCYYLLEGNRFLFAREIRFIANLMNGLRFDRFALAQYLVLGYILQWKTFLENVQRFPAATVLMIEPGPGAVEMRTLYQRNYEEEEHAGRSLAENVEALVERFDQVCRNRMRQADGTAVVLGMSGGRDSRAVCSGLTRAEADFKGLSFHYQHIRNAAPDVEVAQEMAQRFGVDWQRVEIQAPTGAEVLDLLQLKGGLNDLGLAFMITFLKTMRAFYQAPVTYATGDTGLAPRYLLPSQNLRSMNHLLNYTISHNGYMTAVQASRLLGLRSKDILEHLRADLQAFPERDLNRKYFHLLIHGRCFKWHYEGMDRNRCYTWLMAPLEAPPFWDYSLHCPQQQKKGWRLYDQFLYRLSGLNRGLRLADDNAEPGSLKLSLQTTIRSFYDNFSLDTKRLIKTYVLRNWSGYNSDSLPVRLLGEMFDRCSALGDHMYRAETEVMSRWCSRLQLDNILSVAAAIEHFTTGKSSLDLHQGELFD